MCGYICARIHEQAIIKVSWMTSISISITFFCTMHFKICVCVCEGDSLKYFKNYFFPSPYMYIYNSVRKKIHAVIFYH